MATKPKVLNLTDATFLLPVGTDERLLQQGAVARDFGPRVTLKAVT